MEPSHTTRFLEVICGDQSEVSGGEYLAELSQRWGKEPTLGIARTSAVLLLNRLMYALYREAFYLVENGYATVEDVDRRVSKCSGYWMTLVGPFRWMDLTGVPAYHAV
jgi:3-hydroxybutyryl-CoA dehydrogenase